MLFEKLADFIMRYSRVIVAIWIILLLVSVPFMMRSSSVLQYDMSKMTSSGEMESIKGGEMLNSGYFNSGSSLDAGTIIIVEVKDAIAKETAEEMKDNLTTAFFFWDVNKELRAEGGLNCEITVKLIGRFDDKYFADKDTQMAIFTVSYPEMPEDVKMKPSNNIPAVRSMVADAKEGVEGVVQTYVTGTDAISYDTNTGSTNDIKHIDPISILLVLILIGLFFKSIVSAGTPPVIIGMAYGILLTLVYGIGQVLGIYYITTILVLVSMLGAGCDYCIFIISRYREERKEGKPHQEALRESIIWAGESIITSGISVIIGFGSLTLCSFSLVSTMGLILALGIVLALLAALTFVPSLLNIVGDKIFWPSKVSSYNNAEGWYARMGQFGHRYFTHSAKSAIKYAKIIFVVTLLLTVPLAYVALTSSSSYDMISAMPPGEAKEGVNVISQNIGGGVLMPTTVSMKVDAFVDVNVNTDLQSGGIVPLGSDVIVTATPATGYRVAGWIQDGVYTPAMANEKSFPVAASTDVTAVFEKIKYTVTFSPNDAEYGSVAATVNGSKIVSGQNAYYGNEISFKATANPGYRVLNWYIERDGEGSVEHSHDTELTIGLASHDYNIVVDFAPTTTVNHAVTYASVGSGTITAKADGASFNSGSSVMDRSYVVFTAIPDDGYKVKGWTLNGTPMASANTLIIDDLTADADVSVEFEQKTVSTHTLIFSSSNVDAGTVTATVDGVPVESGATVTDGSKVVITATPKGDNVVNNWHYVIKDIPAIHIPIFDIDVPLGDIDYYTYKDTREHIITNYSLSEEITVTFGPGLADVATITLVDPVPASASLVALQNGREITSGSTVMKGTNVFFVANVPDGYHIKEWTVTDSSGAETIKITDETLSLYDIQDDTTVTYEAEVDDYVTFTFGSNDDSLGSVKATCPSISQLYVERPNAPEVYAKLNDFALNMMELTTDGKKNVAMVIGPMNGDILFDGRHEWMMDTVAGILPSEYQRILGSGIPYDALAAIWDDYATYALKKTFNYYISYKLGMISEPFSEVEGGPEYQYVKFMVVTKDEPMSALSVETIKQIYGYKDQFVEENRAGTANGFVYSAYLSGAAVSNYEMSELVNKDFRFIIVIVIVLLVSLLFLVMRSYLTPIRAVGTILMSVLWTLGLTYILFDHLLGIPVVWVVPIVLFVVCLGLGMDYDILLTTRIKEFVTKGMSNDDAIVAAVQKSGAIITLCGLIMAGAFGTMMVSTSPMLQEFGFALGFAIAVDALIIRTYIVPAIMHIMGDWNWKGPNFMALKKRVEIKKEED